MILWDLFGHRGHLPCQPYLPCLSRCLSFCPPCLGLALYDFSHNFRSPQEQIVNLGLKELVLAAFRDEEDAPSPPLRARL